MAGALGVLSSWAHGPGICRVLSKFWCQCTYIWEKYRKITCEQLMSGFHQWCLSSTCVHLEKNTLNFRGVNVVFLFFVGYNLKVLPAGKHSKDDIKGVGDFGSTTPKKLPPFKESNFLSKEGWLCSWIINLKCFNSCALNNLNPFSTWCFLGAKISQRRQIHHLGVKGPKERSAMTSFRCSAPTR